MLDPSGDLVPLAAVGLVAGFEGFRSKVYPDPGTGGTPWTQGYGSTRDEAGRPFGPTSPEMPQDRAKALLKRDLQAAAKAVESVSKALSDPCKSACISLAYNIGSAAFTTSTLAKRVREGDLFGAADQFPVWNRAGGKVLNGLVTRRAAERKVFLSGLGGPN